MLLARCLLTTLLVAVGVAAPAIAQTAHAPFGQIAAGRSTMSGGVLSPRDFSTVELGFGLRPLPEHVPAFVVEFVGASTLLSGGSLECPISPDGGCARFVDEYKSAALLVGAELRGRLGGVGLMVGPTGFSSASASGWGTHVQAELVTRSYRGLTLLIVPRFVSVSNVHQATLSFRSVSFGLRIR